MLYVDSTSDKMPAFANQIRKVTNEIKLTIYLDETGHSLKLCLFNLLLIISLTEIL